jgi:hypothetical protein
MREVCHGLLWADNLSAGTKDVCTDQYNIALHKAGSCTLAVILPYRIRIYVQASYLRYDDKSFLMYLLLFLGIYWFICVYLTALSIARVYGCCQQEKCYKELYCKAKSSLEYIISKRIPCDSTCLIGFDFSLFLRPHASVEWTALLHIGRGSGSNISLRSFLNISLPAGRCYDFTNKLDHESSLPHHFQWILYWSSYHLTIHSQR